MAVNRVLYASQSVLITVGGALQDMGVHGGGAANNVYDYVPNVNAGLKTGKNTSGSTHFSEGFAVHANGAYGVLPFILPVQSANVDTTIPQDDVLVMGNLGGVKRLQKDVATSKCSVKSYLAESMSWYDGSTLRNAGVSSWADSNNDGNINSRTDYTPKYDPTSEDEVDPAENEQMGIAADSGPLAGITHKGGLAGEAWFENTKATLIARQGLLEQLIWESMGGYESRVECYHSVNDNAQDGFSFYGVLSSISIDASKGAYPTLDLSWEGVGEAQVMNMGHVGAVDANGAAFTTGGLFYIDSCHPHTSDDVLVWGREQTYERTGGTYKAANAAGTKAEDQLILIASNKSNFYDAASGLDRFDTDPINIDDSDIGHQGASDTLSSAKLSYDLPTETLTALGKVIEGNTTTVRAGNATFSKPPFKASLTIDGHGLIMAGHESYHSAEIEEKILPNEIQIGELHCVLDPDSSATASRSFSQAVGDVGASYNIAVEGTAASFHGTYQKVTASTAGNVTNDWNTSREIS